MNWRILQAMLLLNILTLSTVSTAGAGDGLQTKQVVFPEMPVSVHFPASEQLKKMRVTDVVFTPDDRGLLVLTTDSLYRLDLHTEIIELVATSPGLDPMDNWHQMEWLDDNQALIFSFYHENGVVLKWPTLEKMKENLRYFALSFDRRSILYQEQERSPYILWDLSQDEEESLPPLSALRFVDFNPSDKTILYTQGASKLVPSGYEIESIAIESHHYASGALIDPVTLEGAHSGEWVSWYVRSSLDLFLLDRIKVDQLTYLLGTLREYNDRAYTVYTYTPFIWNESTGKAINEIFGSIESVSHYGFFPPPYGLSPNGQWMALAINQREMKIIPIEKTLRGVSGEEIGPFPKGDFSFSQDSTKMALLYIVNENSNLMNRELAIIDLELANPVNDFPLHQN